MVSIKKEDLIDLIDKGITYREIAEIIGVSYSSIAQRDRTSLDWDINKKNLI